MKKKAEKVMKIVVDILLGITAIAIIFSLYGLYQLKVQNRKYFNLFGYTAFSVVTGSMSPTLEIGDVIIVKVSQDIKKDDIITYYKDDSFITHRVIKIEGKDIIARGDSNNSVDSPINKDMVVGKVVHRFKKASSFIDVLLTPKIFISIVITLFLFSICVSYIPKKSKVKYDKDGIEILDIGGKKKWYQKNVF